MAPYEATKAATPKAARAPPNTSSGNEYTLALCAETAKKLRAIPAVVQPGACAAGMQAVNRDKMAAATQTRKRATAAIEPRWVNRSDNQPPAKPPSSAKMGGIHA